MKRQYDLWPCVTSFGNLVRAAQKSARGKRNQRSVARFQYDLESGICALQDELLNKTYQPGF